MEFNRGAEKLLDYTRSEVLGKTCVMLFGSDRNKCLLEDLASASTPAQRSTSLTKRDGSTVETVLHVSSLRGEDGEVVGKVWIGRDVTELRAAQIQLAQTERLSAIGEVISGVAHELNNPLSGVIGFSQLLMARHIDGPVVRALEKINESGLRCQRIIRNLLSFARRHKAERKYLGINGIVEKTLDLKKYQLRVNNIEVVRELDPNVPCTMIDFHQIQQVFLNLINNAQQAMACVRDRAGRLIVRTSFTNGMIRAEFIDNGEGIDGEILQRIFDPFFTTKAQGEGTGLGLSASYGIVKEHGGRIYATNRNEEGTIFIVELPICPQALEDDEEIADENTTATDNLTAGGYVLIVDDEPFLIDLLMEVLEDAGHRVDTASNGEEAHRKVVANRYDVVITDIHMPQMNGIELYRQILQERPELDGRVVLVTGDLVNGETAKFLSEVNVRTLRKPLEISRITETVRQILTLSQDFRHPAEMAPRATIDSVGGKG
jgi:PAS domain S-box-containing protein